MRKNMLIKIVSCIAVLSIVFAAVAGLGANAAGSGEFTKSSLEFVSGINVGMNIGNSYDVAEVWGGPTSWGAPVVTEDLIKSVKARGFNAVRLPVTWFGSGSEKVIVAPDYKISASWMSRVKQVVDWIFKYDMYVIINMHHENEWLGTLSEDEYKNNPAKFKKTIDIYSSAWKQIATTFKNYGEKLIFEAHNEVRDRNTQNNWKGSWTDFEQIRIYNQTFVNTVRATGGNNAKRYLIFKSYAGGLLNDYYFNYDEENNLEPTYNPIPNDPANHLIYSFHSYYPGLMCMTQKNQNASTNVTTYDRTDLINKLEGYAKTVTKQYISRGIAVIVGEMGSINKNNIESRLSHAQLFIDTMGKHGIKCFWWENGMSRVNNGGSDGLETFGLVDRNNPSNWPFANIADMLINTGNKYVGVLPGVSATTTKTPATTTKTPATTKTPGGITAGSYFCKYQSLHYAKSEGWHDGAKNSNDLSAYVNVDPKGNLKYSVPAGVVNSQQIYVNFSQDLAEKDRMIQAVKEANSGSGKLMFDITVNAAKDKNGKDATVGFRYSNIAGKSLSNDKEYTIPLTTGKTERIIVDIPSTDSAIAAMANYSFRLYFKNYDNWDDALTVLDVSATPIVVLVGSEDISSTTSKPGTTIYGDANGDGIVSLPDLLSIRKYLAKWNSAINISAADCNGDGNVTLLDLILMRKYLAKWDVVLGPQK